MRDENFGGVVFAVIKFPFNRQLQIIRGRVAVRFTPIYSSGDYLSAKTAPIGSFPGSRKIFLLNGILVSRDLLNRPAHRNIHGDSMENRGFLR